MKRIIKASNATREEVAELVTKLSRSYGVADIVDEIARKVGYNLIATILRSLPDTEDQ